MDIDRLTEIEQIIYSDLKPKHDNYTLTEHELSVYELLLKKMGVCNFDKSVYRYKKMMTKINH